MLNFIKVMWKLFGYVVVICMEIRSNYISAVMVALYQPFILLFSISVIYGIISALLGENIYIFVFCWFFSIPLALFFNGMIETVLCLASCRICFRKLFHAQNKIDDFVFMVISLLAIYAALRNGEEALILNRILLVISIIFLNSWMVNALYEIYFIKKRIVSKYCKEIKSKSACR